MTTSKWEKIRGRIAPTTVQQLLDHTEEVNEQIERVLVGLYNDMTDHRVKVEEVSSKLEEVKHFAETLQKLDRESSDFGRRISSTEDLVTALSDTSSVMRSQIRSIYRTTVVNCVAIASILIAIFIR